MKKKIMITVDLNTAERFKEYCKEKGMKVSSRIEVLINEDLDLEGVRNGKENNY